jgi:hypothetical protein
MEDFLASVKKKKTREHDTFPSHIPGVHVLSKGEALEDMVSWFAAAAPACSRSAAPTRLATAHSVWLSSYDDTTAAAALTIPYSITTFHPAGLHDVEYIQAEQARQGAGAWRAVSVSRHHRAPLLHRALW